MGENRCIPRYIITKFQIMKTNRKSYKFPQRKTCLIKRHRKNNNFYCFNFSVGYLKVKEQHYQVTEQK